MGTSHLKDQGEFEKLIATHAITLVDFYSTDCPPCEKLAPIYERLAAKYPDVKFAKIFRQENRELALEHGVTSSPTILFFCHGTLQDKRLSGDISEAELERSITELISKEKNVYHRLENPTITETHDLAIIGAGPAGLTAAVYAARYRIDQVLIGELPGGLMTSSHKICNYPSETETTGMELTRKMTDHVVNLGVPQWLETVKIIEATEGRFQILTTGSRLLKVKAILLATGTKHKRLGLPDEDRLIGRGISYCATCDAMFFRNKTVGVVGGSDAANTAALYLADIADKVYQIYRGRELRGETAWIEQIQANPKIITLFETNITKLLGQNRLEAVELDRPYEGVDRLALEGLFVEIGSDPDRTLSDALGLTIDDKGYIVTAPDQKTSRDGVWAAGDITTNSDGFRQIVTACSEGAIAAHSIYKYLMAKKA